MSATQPITAQWLADPANKLSNLPISAATLELINKSETLKAQLRDYASSSLTTAAQVHSNANAAEYSLYGGDSAKAFANIGANRFADAEGAFNVLVHEIGGHGPVEMPGASVANARANALANGNTSAYENACNLTEGYALYAEVKARQEVLDANRAQAAAEGRSLTIKEQILEDRWSGKGTYASDPIGKAYHTVKNIEAAAGAYGQLLTPEQIVNAAAYALGENNKSNTTSTTALSYLEFCRKSADDVIGSGANPPASAPVQEHLTTIYSPDGTVASRVFTAILNDGNRLTTVYDGYGDEFTQTREIPLYGGAYRTVETRVVKASGDEITTQYDGAGRRYRVTETDGAGDNADYHVRETTYDRYGSRDYVNDTFDDGSSEMRDYAGRYVSLLVRSDAQGRTDYTASYGYDGDYLRTDHDQDGSQVWDRISTKFDAQGRQDWSNTSFDNGSYEARDFDQNNELDWRSTTTFYDPQGRTDFIDKESDDGTRIRWNYDQDSSQGWSMVETHFDAQGREDWSAVTFRDGTRTTHDYDQNGDQSWSQITWHHDAQGREDFVTTIANDGSRVVHDYDQDGSQGRGLLETHFDAQGRQDWSAVTFNDGTRKTTDWDQDGQHDWSQRQWHIDAAGQTVRVDTFLRDGSSAVQHYDHSGSHGWRLTASTFDAQGRHDWSGTWFNDGSSDSRSFDVDGSKGWSQVLSRYDEQDRKDWTEITMNDSRIVRIDFDQTNERGDRFQQSHFDVPGRLDWKNTVMDDGRRLVDDFDQDGSKSWSSFQSRYDASGQLDSSSRYFDDGVRFEIDYNWNGVAQTKYDAFNAAGQYIYSGTEHNNSGVILPLSASYSWNPAWGEGIRSQPLQGGGGSLAGPWSNDGWGGTWGIADPLPPPDADPYLGADREGWIETVGPDGTVYVTGPF